MNEANNAFVASINASMKRVGHLRSHQICKKDLLVVKGFHPSKFLVDKYVAEDVKEWSVMASDQDGWCNLEQHRGLVLRSCLKLVFAVAANAVVGNEIRGLGILNIRDLIEHNGPILKMFHTTMEWPADGFLICIIPQKI